MDPTALRKNFENQIEETEKQIVELEKNLEKAKEYKIKLLGGLETLNLLEQEEPQETE
jgi:ferritin-like metal-binding protein YciE